MLLAMTPPLRITGQRVIEQEISRAGPCLQHETCAIPVDSVPGQGPSEDPYRGDNNRRRQVLSKVVMAMGVVVE